ncbi:MAG: hypothetical protein ACKO38_00420, partial [Planctomycetota bacterium]
ALTPPLSPVAAPVAARRFGFAVSAFAVSAPVVSVLAVSVPEELIPAVSVLAVLAAATRAAMVLSAVRLSSAAGTDLGAPGAAGERVPVCVRGPTRFPPTAAAFGATPDRVAFTEPFAEPFDVAEMPEPGLGDFGACPAERLPSMATKPRLASQCDDNRKASRPDRVMRVCSWPENGWGQVDRVSHPSLDAGGG